MKAGQITAKLRDAVPVCFYTNPDNVYKVKGENGNVFWIDERQIIGIVAL